MLADDPVDRGEPQPGSAPGFLGREEGLEDVLQHRRGNPNPRVGDADARVGAGRHRAAARDRARLGHVSIGADRDHAALRHGVARVDDKVHDHLLELDRIDPQPTKGIAQLQLEPDVVAHEPPEHFLQVADGRVQVDDPRLRRGAAAERQELARERRGALPALADFVDGRPRRIGGGHPAEQEIGVPQHRGQDVIEVVRHAAGQLPDGLHLLRVAELLFQHHAVGDVHLDAVDVDDAVRLEPRRPAAPVPPPDALRRLVADLERRGLELEELLQRRDRDVLRVVGMHPAEPEVGVLIQVPRGQSVERLGPP